MRFNEVHCLFEQSGTFKLAFELFGYKAYDYDIEWRPAVDFRIDIFKDIELEISEFSPTLFDGINKEDLVMAFFPCTYFSDQSMLLSRGDSAGQKNWDLARSLERSCSDMERRADYYRKLCLLVQIALKKGFKLVIENPYGKCGFLRQYFPLKPDVIIKDRRDFGDKFQKPTQFFFINCEPAFNLFSGVEKPVEKAAKVRDIKGFGRSLISKTFAECFIKRYILEEG